MHVERKVKGWFRREGGDTVIVFIHGLFSDNKKCWYNEAEKSYWPSLIAEDSRFDGVDLYLASFHTASDSNDYGISNCADEVISQLKFQDESSNSPPLLCSNIIFLTHSTGGIVARYILESKKDLFLDKKIGLALYASPSYGSKLAKGLGSLSRLFNNKLALELSWGSAILEDLDDRFRDLLEQNSLNISGIEVYENRSPFHVNLLNNSKSRVVEKLSAARYFGKPKLIPESNHSSIVKPKTTSDYQHTVLVNFLEDKNFINISKRELIPLELEVSTSSKQEPKKPDVLFDIYHPIHESVYIKREEDELVRNAIKSSGLWVCGQTGVGKTTSIQRALAKIGANFKYISLSVCVNEPIEVLFNEIYSRLVNDDEYYENSIKDTLKKIEKYLTDFCKDSDLILFIEEIPISDQDMFFKFSEYIYALIAQMNKVSNFKIILSSIFEPKICDGNEFEKVMERLKVIKSSKWSDVEMEQLVNIIEDNLDIKDSRLDQISDFCGSPRKAKIYYRDIAIQINESS